jgi:hypothetical protein
LRLPHKQKRKWVSFISVSACFIFVTKTVSDSTFESGVKLGMITGLFVSGVLLVSLHLCLVILR